MFCPGRPPNTAIVVLWHSLMSVINRAQVDAQFPFVTKGEYDESKLVQYAEGNTNSNLRQIERSQNWNRF